MSDQNNADYRWFGHPYVPSSKLVVTSSEAVDELLLMFASGDPNNGSLLHHLFSVTFIEYDDYDSFFKRLLFVQKPPIPLMKELKNIELLSAYFEDVNLSNNPIVRYLKSFDSPLWCIFQFENFSENPEFPINVWQWLDYFLDGNSSKNKYSFNDGWSGDEIIKWALFYAAMQSNLDSESDKFEQYMERVIEKLGPRRDVLFSYTCFKRRQGGQSLQEISEIDPWDGY